jgi:redox-sensitive bicupin YhaK (pirin superfamily)
MEGVSNLEQHPAEHETGASVALAVRRDVLAGRDVPLGKYSMVNRLLPHTNRRMVGAWCFLDHFGPDAIFAGPGMQVPPHPHCGLQTVTWLLDGEVLHRDSLGSLAMIRPGQLNLMTAAHGIAHAEESPDGHGPSLHGLQLWIALPAREAAAASTFEHHADLPGTSSGGAYVTVVVGSLGRLTSPAHVHSPIVGADVRLEAGASATVPLRADWEYAVVVMAGAADVADGPLAPGSLCYLGTGRESLTVSTASGARLFLLGGEPFADDLVMWWNFVGRSHEEIVAAREAWMAGAAIAGPQAAGAGPSAAGDRFGAVTGYDGAALPAPAMPTTRLKPRDRHGRPMPDS